jgi:hypothetical protein
LLLSQLVLLKQQLHLPWLILPRLQLHLGAADAAAFLDLLTLGAG